jgi:hypothetical protein
LETNMTKVIIHARQCTEWASYFGYLQDST